MGLAYRGEYGNPEMIELELERLDALTTGANRVMQFPIGGGCYWWGTTPPNAGWILCEGQSLNQIEYPALYAVWGVTHGGGNDNGVTQFSAPTLEHYAVRAR